MGRRLKTGLLCCGVTCEEFRFISLDDLINVKEYLGPLKRPDVDRIDYHAWAYVNAGGSLHGKDPINASSTSSNAMLL